MHSDKHFQCLAPWLISYPHLLPCYSNQRVDQVLYRELFSIQPLCRVPELEELIWLYFGPKNSRIPNLKSLSSKNTTSFKAAEINILIFLDLVMSLQYNYYLLECSWMGI